MIYNQEKEIKRFWIYLVVILLSLITTLGFTLDAVPEQITIIKYIKEHINGILLLLAISVFCYGVAIPLVFKKIDAATLISKKSTESGDDYIFAECHCFKYIAIIFLCWLPYLIITYPAITVGYDFFWQLLQGVGAFPLSNHHPVLGSIIYGVIYSIGYELGGATFGLFLISFLQMLLMTSVLGLGISLLVDMGVHHNVYRIILAIICLNPIFPTNAIWLIKDSVFTSLCILFFLQIFTYIWCKSRLVKIPFIASLPMIVTVGVAFSFYRNGAKPIAIVTLILLAFVTIKNAGFNSMEKRKQFERVLISCSVYIAIVLGCNLLISSDDIYPTNIRETMSLPSRCVMHYIELWPNDITKEEKQILEKVYKDSLSNDVSIYDLSKEYNNTNADPIKISYIEEKNTIIDFIRVFVSMGAKHPGTYIDAVLHGTDGYWWFGINPNRVVRAVPLDMVENDFANDGVRKQSLSSLFLPTVKSLEYNNINIEQTMEMYLKNHTKIMDLFDVKSAFPEARQTLGKLIDSSKNIPIISLAFVPGTYVLILLVSLAYLFSRKKEGQYVWPIVMIIALACLSPINGYTRYVLPIELFSLFLVGICFVPEKSN